MRSPITDRVLQLAEQAGVLRPRDLLRAGIDPKYLDRLYRAGRFERAGRGLYVLTDQPLSEQRALALMAARLPQGIVCLLSALRFHEIGTQQPFAVWLALPNKARRPIVADLPLRIVRFSGPSLTAGIEEHTLEGVAVRLYTPAKTIADCFKYRNKIGLDVALEALRDAWQRRLVTMDDLWRYAAVCRVANVMRPYLESLT